MSNLLSKYSKQHSPSTRSYRGINDYTLNSFKQYLSTFEFSEYQKQICLPLIVLGQNQDTKVLGNLWLDILCWYHFFYAPHRQLILLYKQHEVKRCYKTKVILPILIKEAKKWKEENGIR